MRSADYCTQIVSTEKRNNLYLHTDVPMLKEQLGHGISGIL